MGFHELSVWVRQTTILLISTSQVARITGVGHCTWLYIKGLNVKPETLKV
jgi:hypothetical protein